MPKQEVTAKQLETLERTLKKLKTEMCQLHSHIKICYKCLMTCHFIFGY
jgi:hypothetical protein